MPWFITVQVHKRIVRTKKRRYQDLPVPYTSLHHHQYRWGKQRSGMEDREGKPGFACQSTAGNSPLSQLIIRNGSLHNDWQQRHVKEKRSFQSDVKMNSQVSRVRHGFLSLKGFWVQRILEPVRFHGCPGLTLHGQYQESCTEMVDRHGRPPRICFTIGPAGGRGLGGPFCPHCADLASLSSPLLRRGDTMDTETGKHKDADQLLPPLPCLPPFQKMHSYIFRLQNGARTTTSGPFFLLLLLKQIK